MKTFKFVWNDGKVNYGFGEDVADAAIKLGIQGGALAAMDYYDEVSDDDLSNIDLIKEVISKTTKVPPNVGCPFAKGCWYKENNKCSVYLKGTTDFSISSHPEYCYKALLLARNMELPKILK